MTPVDQSILHDPANGRYGDCMRAVIASLLELPISAVPHFLEDGCGADEFNRRINEWLRPMNMAYMPLGPLDAWIKSYGIKGLHHEIAGETERGTFHACTALDGELTHDPHPSRAGIKRAEVHGLFIVLDPSKPTGDWDSA